MTATPGFGLRHVLSPALILGVIAPILACDPGQPGVAHAELSWTGSGAATTWIRSADDLGLLPLGAAAWPAVPDACVPLSGRDLVFFSVAESCQLGGEGMH
jgi:hypothetical protein